MFAIYFKHVYDIYVYQHTEALLPCFSPQKGASSGIYVNWINFKPSMG